MSPLRLAATRPLLALRAAPARVFSTTAARKDVGGNPTTDLYKSVMSGVENQSKPAFPRFQLNRDPAETTAQSTPSSHRFARDMVEESMPSTAEEVDHIRLRSDLENQMPRRWQTGDVYAPHDLTGVEARKSRRRKQSARVDAFDHLALNPLKEYKNFAIMSSYMTELGRIKHHRDTGLRPVNQRKIAKAVRRAIGIGIMPSVHIHPELIKPSHHLPY